MSAHEVIFLDFASGRPHVLFEILNRDQDFSTRRSSMEGKAMLADQPIKQGNQLMSEHVTISPNEAADRLAIRELVEAYAHCADRRDAKGQKSLFTSDTHFVVYMNAKDPRPSQELHSREALSLVFADLNKYDATTHFVGQSTIFTLTDDRATGEAYCLAHHVTVDNGKRHLMLASLRYLDTFVKIDGAWLFAERLLYVDWLEERTLS
jgi:SnoaL-like domain